MSNGSENYKDDWFKVMESAGATKLNGTTWYDRTNYFQNVPTSALDMTLWMESDRMGHLLGAIDQKVLDEQRGVVQNEKRQRQNQPYGKASEMITLSTYPTGHPYSWEPIGSMEDLNAASLEDVKDWFRAYYGAANAVLVIAGDITAAEAKQKVEKYFGDIPAGPPIRRQMDSIAKMEGTHRAVMQDAVPQARIYKVWNIPGYRHRDFIMLDMASDVLGGGKNSRLYKRLVYTDRSATAVAAGVSPFEIGSQLQIIVTVKPGGDPVAVEKAIDEEVARFLAAGPTPAELDRIRTTNYANFARGMERIDGFGGKSSIPRREPGICRLAGFPTRRGSTGSPTPHRAMQEVAKRWMSDGVFVLNVEPVATFKTLASTVDRSKVPTPGAAPSLKLPTPERAKLSMDSGLSSSSGTAPRWWISRCWPTRVSRRMHRQARHRATLHAHAQEGTKTRSSVQIAEIRVARRAAGPSARRSIGRSST
jgi:zinc protease